MFGRRRGSHSYSTGIALAAAKAVYQAKQATEAAVASDRNHS